MKMITNLLVAGSVALTPWVVSAQTSLQKTNSTNAQAAELEYLRRLLAEQQKHPDKIIRSLPVPTAEVATNQAGPAREKGVAAPAPQPGPAVATPAPVATTPQQEKISEVETRIDEMLRQKAAREKAALTNAAGATNNLPATPQTKRQRLDMLLKQMIDGKISEAEYNEKRGKILAEPN
jgi:hypothetical protein